MRTGLRAVAAMAVWAAMLCAQSADTLLLRARLAEGDAGPAYGFADVRVSFVRGQDGAVQSGTLSFRFSLPEDDSIYTSGLLAREGAAADFELLPASFAGSVQASVVRQRHVDGSSDADLAVLRALIENPAAVTLRLVAQEPGRILSGPLEVVQRAVLLTALDGWGAASADLSTTRDAAGVLTSARLTIGITSAAPPPAGAGLASLLLAQGDTQIDLLDRVGALLPAALPQSASGASELTLDLDVTRTEDQTLAYALLSGLPVQVSLGTAAGDKAAGRLRRAARAEFRLTALRDNQPAAFTALALYATLNAEGSVGSFLLETDCNYRLLAGIALTGLTIADTSGGAPPWQTGMAASGEIDSGAGFGNFYGMEPVNSMPPAVANAILANGERFEWRLATTTSPSDGTAAVLAVRLAPPRARPSLLQVVSAADGEPAVSAGGLVSVRGDAFSASVATLDDWDSPNLPRSLSGLTVELGQTSLPLIYVTPGEVRAQLPFETEPGVYPLRVRNSIGVTADLAVRVDALAPAILRAGDTAFALHAADYALVTAANPAAAGETVLIYATGLGPTVPPLATGALAPVDNPPPPQAVIRVWLGDRECVVTRAVAAEGFAGTYKIEAVVPDLSAGRHPLVISAGDVRSSAAQTSVR